MIIHNNMENLADTGFLLSLYSTTYGGYLQASPLLSLKYCSSSVYVVKAVITLNIIYLFPHTAFAGRQGSSATSSQEPGQGIVCRQVAAVILLSTHQLTITITHSTYSARRHSKPVASVHARAVAKIRWLEACKGNNNKETTLVATLHTTHVIQYHIV